MTGRVPSEPDPREPSPAVSALTGFDPSRVGICAYDLDEMTVTLALDTEAEVRALLSSLPPKSRVKICDDDKPRCACCGRFLSFDDLSVSAFHHTPLNEFGPEENEWIGPCCRYRDRDRSGEAGKTGTGLAEGESPGRETASPHTSPPSSPQAG